MPESVVIRPATSEDLHSLITLLETLFSIEEDFVIDTARQLRGLEMMLNNGRGRILVAEADGTVVGMCSGQLMISTAEGSPAVLIEDVIVHQDWRGHGVGSKLMEGINVWARENETTRMQLLADRNNVPALAFYKNLGWEQTQLVCLINRLES